MKRRIWILIGIIVVATASCAVYGLLIHHSSKQTGTATQSAAKTEQPVQVALPGATAITALKQDYTQPSSLWVVVSKQYPLADAHYRPTDLVVPNVATNSQKTTDEQSVSKTIQPDLENLFAGAKSAGYDLMVASGFRSYDLQQEYFSSYSATYGEAAANKFSALPGQSEHQTGLAFDISYTDRACYLDTCFGDEPAGKWLAMHAWQYGFVLRYPADKTAVTQYQYEPWHFRYVGKDLARALHESGLTLDEAKPYLVKADAQLKARGEL